MSMISSSTKVGQKQTTSGNTVGREQSRSESEVLQDRVLSSNISVMRFHVAKAVTLVLSTVKIDIHVTRYILE